MIPFNRRTVLALSALALTATGTLAADERGSKDEAIALANAAFEHIKKVGAGKAYNDFTTDKATWTKKGLYVMVCDSQAVALAHGGNAKLVGKDMSAVKDANGVPVVTGLIGVAARGGGWLDYDWPDPLTKKLMAKSTYARKQPNGQGFIGVGIYR